MDGRRSQEETSKDDTVCRFYSALPAVDDEQAARILEGRLIYGFITRKADGSVWGGKAKRTYSLSVESGKCRATATTCPGTEITASPSTTTLERREVKMISVQL